MASALPYVELSSTASPAQPYGVLLMAGIGLGALVAVLVGRRRGLSGEDLGVLLPSAVAAALIGGHLFDAAWYARPGKAIPWFDVFVGHSLTGALAAVAAITAIVGAARRLDRAVLADVVAIGALVALTVGRVGCALVHDHPGGATDAVFGVDMPAYRAGGDYVRPPDADVIRIHDAGLEELLVLLVLLPCAFVLLRRWRARPGLLAGVVAIAYAVIRFGLDVVRLRSTEPTRGGLTGGQWGMVAMLVVAAVALLRRRRPAAP